MATIEERLHLLETLDLKHGSHLSREAGMCAMEAAAWIAGEPHSDQPACVCPVIAGFMRSWNDALPDDAARNRWLRPLLPAVLNTASTVEQQVQRAFLCADWAVRIVAPRALEAAVDALDRAGIADHPARLRECAANLRALPAITDRSAAESAWAAAAAAAAAAEWLARSAASSAAAPVAWAARSAAESAARSAEWLARPAASSAAAPVAWAAESAARSAESASAAAAAAEWSAESAGSAAWAAESAWLARSAAWSVWAAWAADDSRQETQEFVRRLLDLDGAA